jgi:hypothetical protein
MLWVLAKHVNDPSMTCCQSAIDGKSVVVPHGRQTIIWAESLLSRNANAGAGER